MKKNVLLFVLLVLTPCMVFAQQWQQYSDSIISNIKKNNYNKATYFIDLADNDIKKSSVIKDTIYADYLYRKGVVKYDSGKFDAALFEESLSIWELMDKKNYTKLMKIHFFLGAGYHIRLDYLKGYEHYEKCYSINKKNKLTWNANFANSMYYLAMIEYEQNKNFTKAKKYAEEYLEYNKDVAFTNFDFKYVYAYRWKDNDEEFETTLLEFDKKYDEKKINNPQLKFKINFELFNYYYKIYSIKEIIKYGEKSLELYHNLNIIDEKSLKSIYPRILWAYREIKDNINIEKYQVLCDLFPDKTKVELDYYYELDKIWRDKNSILFKIKFEEFENKFKDKSDYDKLLELYDFFLREKKLGNNVVFTDDDFTNRINYVIKYRNKLTKINLLKLDLFLADFHKNNKKYTDALKICEQNSSTNDIKSKLEFLSIKFWCENGLGNFTEEKKVAYEAYETFKQNYGEEDPGILPYLIRILNSNHLGNDVKSTKIVTKTLNILYENKLENTQASVRVWNALGEFANFNNNYIDAINYFEKSIKIQEKSETINDEYIYYNALSTILFLKVTKTEDDDWELYSKKLETFLLQYPEFTGSISGELNLYLGDINMVRLKFGDAVDNFKLAFSILGEEQSKMLKFNFIVCKYFLDNNIPEAIKLLESFQKENVTTNHISNFVYLLKYNTGDFSAAKKHLTNQLEMLILDNNQYFHLLSGYEKEILYKKFSEQFEFLNTYLLDANPSFLNQFIDLRFYGKSLLFSNLSPTSSNLDKDKELFNEFRNNTIQINKAIETKINDLKSIENLKSRNREIEKFLTVNKKNISIPTLKDLNNKIKQNEAYVEIVRINKQSKSKIKSGVDILEKFSDSIYYGAIIIKKNTVPKFVLIDDTNQLENKYSTIFKSNIKNKKQDSDSYNLLFEKIDRELKDIKKIYLVTDGVYNSINIESIFNPINGKYLIDYLKIQQIQNIRTITEEKKEFKVSATSNASLFGNPNFNMAIATEPEPEFEELSRGLDSALLDEIRDGIKISSLSDTEKEIASLNLILKESQCNVDLYSADKATEDNLKKVQSPDILHIATHGYFLKNDDTSKTKKGLSELFNENYKNDSYLKSGLLLAGAQNTLNGDAIDGTNNGILSAEEAKSLDLSNTDLVVLSACDTGLGNNLVGEGVIGLQRAFMIAGAKSVIMSLWEVDDESTQKLMTLFYTNWIKNKMTKEEALYQAKLEMKKQKPEPYYWAGFVLLE